MVPNVQNLLVMESTYITITASVKLVEIWPIPYFSVKVSGDTNRNEASASTETDGADKTLPVPPKVWNQNFHPQKEIYCLKTKWLWLCTKYDNLATKKCVMINWAASPPMRPSSQNIFSWNFLRNSKPSPFTLIEQFIDACFKHYKLRSKHY